MMDWPKCWIKAFNFKYGKVKFQTILFLDAMYAERYLGNINENKEGYEVILLLNFRHAINRYRHTLHCTLYTMQCITV